MMSTPFIDYDIYDVKGDGYCYWRSLSLGIYGNENLHLIIMNRCMRSKKDSETLDQKWVDSSDTLNVHKTLGKVINIHYKKDREWLVTSYNNETPINYKYSDFINAPDNINIVHTGNHYMLMKEKI